MSLLLHNFQNIYESQISCANAPENNLRINFFVSTVFDISVKFDHFHRDAKLLEMLPLHVSLQAKLV